MTVPVIVTLMLGIGANAVLFSIVYAVLFRPLPYEDPDRLVWIGETGNSKRAGYELVLTSDIADWRAQSRSLARIAALDLGTETLTVNGELDRLWAVGASESPDRILGVSPMIGRGFLPEELRLGGPKVVLLSHRLFRRRFGADSAILGKAISLSGKLYGVVGVLPPGFHLPLSAATAESPIEIEAILSAPIDPAQRRASGALARLKSGVSFETARAELATILETSKKAHPRTTSDGHSDRQLRMAPLHERIVGKSRPVLIALWGTVTFVLLIACINVSSLLLARSAARTRETAIRAALGASAVRLVRQFFAESILLAFDGGTAGLLMALWGVRLLVRSGPLTIPRLRDAALDWNVLLFTMIVSLITGTLFGIAPALTSSHAHPEETLKRSARSISNTRGRQRLHDVFVVCEMALTLVLMTGAALMLKSLWLMNSTSAQYVPEQVLSTRVEPQNSDSPSIGQARLFLNESIRQIEAIPNVRAAGFFVSVLSAAMELPEFPNAISSNDLMHTWFVTPHFFPAAGLRLLAGRTFSDQDEETAPRVAILSENYVRRYGLADDVSMIGRQIRSVSARGPRGKTITVIGVVSDFRRTPDADPRPQIYMPLAQNSLTASNGLYVRASGDPLAIADRVRTVITRDHTANMAGVQTLEEELSIETAPRRFQAVLLGAFAMLSLVLAMVGTYGVFSCAVGERTHEIGIRMALGAGYREVLGMVLVRSGKLVLAALGLGLLGALSVTRLTRSLIYGVQPNDPWIYIPVCLILGSLALVAAYLPARRALRIDPMLALRNE